MFEIVFTLAAVDDLRYLRKHEKVTIIRAIEEQLSHQPVTETRNRKKLRPNEIAEWELRVGSARVFYDIDEAANSVKIEAVGYKKGQRLFIQGEEYQL
ncbi:MAG: type II toxin-antitoxin system RelE/ParE family toxin [Chloroflexi bacterium]|nr:type II toxin-antitoxin system RelE/ParE family toxin [Chloroflexota bacterium]MCL5274864.1 type II toxin-antitoxin system RelE/ParE family toxin [Chloroflexota bacterium]